MASLRVMVVAHDHPEWTTGGTEAVSHDLVQALNARPGVAARFLAAGTRLQRPEAAPGALEAVGPDLALMTGSYDRLTFLRQDGTEWLDGLARVVRAERPDIVHLHGLDRLGAEIVPALRRLAPRSRIVLTLHDYQVICAHEGLMLTAEDALCPGASPDRCRRCLPDIAAARHALRKAHLLAVLSQVDRIVAPAACLRDRLVDWGIAADRIMVIRNAVEAAPPEADGEPGSAGPRRHRFALFGNVARHKGALVLLAAAARREVADARLEVSIHGGLGWADAAFRAAFERALDRAGPVVQHLGPYRRADVHRLMRRADWIVVPSLWYEVAPLVILEAQAAGRPVICTGEGGMAELVRDGVDGIHVPAGDAHALAATMVRVADDPALWTRLAGNARPSDRERHVAEHLSLYRALRTREAA